MPYALPMHSMEANVTVGGDDSHQVMKRAPTCLDDTSVAWFVADLTK